MTPECQLVRFETNPVTGHIEAVNPRLHEMLKNYWRQEFQQECPDLAKYAQVWATLDIDGGKPRVIGVMVVHYLVDVPTFHSQSPKAYAVMYRRLKEYALDKGFRSIAVFVDPKNKPMVGSLMERADATEAQRWLFKANPEIEV